MSVKVAIASTDGKVINQHFGRANKFHIFLIEKDHYEFLESREIEPCCKEQEHHEEAFNQVVALLRDCCAILISKIGDGASLYLEQKGFIIFEAPYVITDVLKKIIEDQLLESEG